MYDRVITTAIVVVLEVDIIAPYPRKTDLRSRRASTAAANNKNERRIVKAAAAAATDCGKAVTNAQTYLLVYIILHEVVHSNAECM